MRRVWRPALALAVLTLLAFTVAIAQRPAPTSAAGWSVIVDDLDGGFSRHGASVLCAGAGSDAKNLGNGTPINWCWQNTGGYNGHYWYTWNALCCGADGNWGEWRPSLPDTRAYRVCAYIPDNHAYANTARYKIYHAGGMTQVNINQQPLVGWTADLGVYTFNGGTGGYVYLGDMTGQTGWTSQVGFDAVQWVADGGACGTGPGGPPPTATAIPSAPTPTPIPPPIPPRPLVVLVHGWDLQNNGDTCQLDALSQHLDDYFQIECFKYKTGNGVSAGALKLKEKIEQWKSERNVSKVDIVAHSMGGLVARFYIEWYSGARNVRSLTMLGTPNRGTPLATPPCNATSWRAFLRLGSVDQGACDMQPQNYSAAKGWTGGSWVLQRLNNPPRAHTGVQYRVITGYRGRPKGVLATPNDCMVEGYRANVGFPADPARWLAHMKQGVMPGCWGVGLAEDGGVQDRLRQILNGSNGISSAPAFTSDAATIGEEDPLPPPDAPADATLAVVADTIAQGETRTIATLLADGQQSVTFTFLVASDPAAVLAFDVLRPEGAVASTTDIDVVVETIDFGDASLFMLTVNNPPPGDWTGRITATALPAVPWPFEIRILTPSNIDLTAAAGAGDYASAGAPLPVSASLTDAGVGIAGAVVLATVEKPNGQILSLQLADNGGGSYSASLADTASCGVYRVGFVADGTLAGAPFERAALDNASIAVVGSILFDPCVGDTDGDGINDGDEVFGASPMMIDTDGDLISDGPIGTAGPPAVAPGPDNCPTTANGDQADSDSDLLGDACEISEYGTNPAAADTDGDGCVDGREARVASFAPNMGGDRDPLNPWDFYDVDSSRSVGLMDTLLILSHFGHASGTDAVDDLLDRDIPDPSKPWRSGESNNGVGLADALANLLSFGHSCSGPP